MSKEKTLIFVTGNKGKLKEVQAILGSVMKVDNLKVDLPELQGDPDEISIEKCKLASLEISKKLGKDHPVIVEDTCLCYNALKGLPGPYIKWFLDKLGHEGLNKLLAGYEDKTAYAQCIFSYMETPKSKPVTFIGKCHGKIVKARGPKNFGWDPVFEPKGFNKTFAEMDKDVKNRISHRSVALGKLLNHLKRVK